MPLVRSVQAESVSTPVVATPPHNVEVHVSTPKQTDCIVGVVIALAKQARSV